MGEKNPPINYTLEKFSNPFCFNLQKKNRLFKQLSDEKIHRITVALTVSIRSSPVSPSVRGPESPLKTNNLLDIFSL